MHSHDQFFVPQLTNKENEVKPWLEEKHAAFLTPRFMN